MKTFAAWLLALLIPVCAAFAGGMPVRIVYKVVDEANQPVEKAKITAGYTIRGDGIKPDQEHPTEASTDSQGLYVYSGSIESVEVWANVKKEGYYRSYVNNTQYWEFQKWTEKNPLVVVLKRIGTPVPMYAKEAHVEFPAATGTFGYDLVLGDLVAPNGTGKIADFVFQVSSEPGKEKLDITFSNPGDGIQPFFMQHRTTTFVSDLTFPHTAPGDNYAPSLAEADKGWREKYQAYHSTDRVWSEEVNYIFRVRSTEKGGALYGRIRGYFMTMRNDETMLVEFRYYLNPDGTNNLEFDPEKNLMEKFNYHESPLHEP